MKNKGLLLSIGFILVSNLNGQGRTCADIDTGYCLLTVTAIGSIGFTSPDTGQGDGFQYPKFTPSVLYYGGMALGNSVGFVADRFGDSDLCLVDSLRRVMPPLWGSEQMYRCLTGDGGHPTPKGLLARSWFMGRGTRYFPGYDDFVILVYDYENPTDSTISNLYSGIFLDFDVGAPREIVRSDSLRRFIYELNSTNPNPTGGLRLLCPRVAANLSLIDHAVYIYPPGRWHDSTRIKFLNGTYRQSQSTRPYDYSICASAGPFNLTPGGKQRVAYAIVGGHDSLKAKEHSDSAQSWYDREVEVEETRSQKLETRHSFRIWSNPAKSDVRLQITDVGNKHLKIKIYDITGKLVKDMSRSIASGVWFRISLNPGIYFINLYDGKMTNVKKVVVVE